LRIRHISEVEQSEVVALLAEGFPSRSTDYWIAALKNLAAQQVPEGKPQFGLGMEEKGRLVGVLLTIWAPKETISDGQNRANLSSWYVKPEYRGFAAMLLAKASSDPLTTYLNVSAAPNTIDICKALGFKQYTQGQVLCAPLLSRPKVGYRVKRYDPKTDKFDSKTDAVLQRHLQMGCLAYVGECGGKLFPFLFVKRHIKGQMPALQLVYSQSQDIFLDFMSALGRRLLVEGWIFVICDTEAPFAAVVSRYFPAKTVKYYKGPVAPRVGDLSFTEIPLFGI
jgi:hypothetical protein